MLVKERADIAEVVGDVVTLRPAGGGNFKGLCPFHDEKSPSFSVRPSVGSFHCFGCQEGGDVISFMMKIDHLTFAETVERLAARYGIQLRYEDGGPTASRAAGRSAHPSRRRAQRRRAVLHRAARDPGGRAGPAVPRRARLRPGGGRALRGRLRAPRVGHPHPAPARPGLHRPGARRWPVCPASGRAGRARSTGSWPGCSGRSATSAATRSGSARAGCSTTTASRRSTSTPPRPRSTRSPPCSTASTSPRRTSRARCRLSSSRATPT